MQIAQDQAECQFCLCCRDHMEQERQSVLNEAMMLLQERLHETATCRNWDM